MTDANTTAAVTAAVRSAEISGAGAGGARLQAASANTATATRIRRVMNMWWNSSAIWRNGALSASLAR